MTSVALPLDTLPPDTPSAYGPPPETRPSDIGPSVGSAPSPTEGAGVVSSWADLAAALGSEQIEPTQVTFCAAAAGLDTLGAVLHPFDSLLQAGIGWLIEHIDFLREPLDMLAGDPAEVLAQSSTWERVATELRTVAAEHRAAVPVPGWEGTAASAYHRAVGELAAALDTGADQAAALSGLILATGAGVGTVRALIRDAITEFLALVLEYLLAAGTLAFLTAGGSLATLVLTVVVRALEVAEDICRRIRTLLEALAAAGGAAGRISASMLRTAERIRIAEPAVRAAAEAFDRAAGEARAPVVIEAGKQLTSTDQFRVP